jgi:hypothetical protein
MPDNNLNNPLRNDPEGEMHLPKRAEEQIGGAGFNFLTT